MAQPVNRLEEPDSVRAKDLIKLYKSKYETFNKAIHYNYRGETRKYLKNVHESMQEQIVRDIKKGEFILDERFTNYVENLKFDILDKNPSLKPSIDHILVSRRISANALSLAEGSIFLNSGLFALLDNKAQLTAVLCHEMAHQKLDHSSLTLLRNAKLSSQTKDKKYLKSFKATGGKSKSEVAFSKLKQLLYSEGSLYRKQEKEADSLGYLFFKKLGYNLGEYTYILNALERTKDAPKITIDTTIYRKIFGTPQLPFKEEWMTMQNYEKYHYEHFKEKITQDSLSTHPENEDRIAHLVALFNIDLNDTITALDNEFLELKELAKKEEISNLYYLEECGLSIYKILYRLQEDKKSDTPYLFYWLGKNFKKLYEAKKKYQVNRYLDRASPKKQDASYLFFLDFMWKLKLDDFKKLANHYTEHPYANN
ncbi:MAG: M48 family metalloprotease [Bacteroidota bacterium]